MKNFTDYASHALGLRIPQDYAGFMETHGKKLSDDPLHKATWIGGLGTADFATGTTLAFRSSIPNLPKDFLVIGYIGSKTIIVNKTYEEIDDRAGALAQTANPQPDSQVPVHVRLYG